MCSKHIEFQEKVQAEVLIFVEAKRSHLKNAQFGSNEDSKQINPFRHRLK